MRMKMAFTFGAQGFILLAFAASFLVVGEARTIIVGGLEGWHFGVKTKQTGLSKQVLST